MIMVYWKSFGFIYCIYYYFDSIKLVKNWMYLLFNDRYYNRVHFKHAYSRLVNVLKT